MLPADCARRLVAELQGALDACAERQRQLDRSLCISRRLLRAWEPAGTLAPEPPPRPENKEEDLTSAYTPSTQDLKELELLTQVLEKAVRVRKGISKPGERDRTLRLKSGPITASPGTTTSVPSQASSQASGHASGARPTKGIHQSRVPAKDHPERRLLSVGDSSHMAKEAQATSCGPGLRHEQMVQSAAPQVAETFTLKEKGTLLQLPVNFRKVASQNSRLWAQLNSAQTSDSTGATSTAKSQFLQKLQGTVSLLYLQEWRLSATEIEVEVQRLRKACVLVRLRMQEELSSAPADWMQEYSCLLTLEGLQAIVGQYLQRLQMLRAAVSEQLPGPCLVERPPQASSPCRGGVDPSWSPQLLFYSSTQELQTLAALKLQVAMLDQQIHLEKVLMAELLPLVSTQKPQELALCRAVHSLLCEGGERFLTILRDDPAF